ncbi:hypothetical protein Cme02nite_72790 [Catellatospora methionotrophica]|uniref:Uncharacterized protein n=1 Tax=Catellatospora methionotrophica TaxID=121620 RepID=A0A8J3PJ02_9ACTN|nr:hypothetical protein [Catellatospora methionotrophica]GIG18947.1 hypothetical protein Cme02nite_72790 [Catellatospora methionotrophica]
MFYDGTLRMFYDGTLRPEFLTEAGHLDRVGLHAAMLAGRPVLR